MVYICSGARHKNSLKEGLSFCGSPRLDCIYHGSIDVSWIAVISRHVE